MEPKTELDDDIEWFLEQHIDSSCKQSGKAFSMEEFA